MDGYLHKVGFFNIMLKFNAKIKSSTQILFLFKIRSIKLRVVFLCND